MVKQKTAYEIVSPPSHGDLTGSGGARTYEPDQDFNGSDSFTYRVTDRGDPDTCSAAPCDGPETSSTETVSLTVAPVNDAPTASPGSRSTDEDTPVALDLADFVNDLETGDGNLAYEIVAQPPVGEGSATPTTFTPAQNFNGTTTFTYRVTDRGDPDNCGAPGAACDGPETSSTETVTITVDPVNDAPVATPTTASTDEDTALPVGLAALVSDAETADGDLTYEI